ncbi:octopamine receptor beta-1R-like [Oculina patagonica]
MVFPQVIAVFHSLFNVIGLPGNLLVTVTIASERRFHVMRYVLLASLAVSDILNLIFVNSFRIASTAQERWLYGQTMCDLNALFLRYFYLNTVLHLIAVSYERYKAIVKSPLTYDGSITKSRVLYMALIWIVPFPLVFLPFFVSEDSFFKYNPEVFFCETDPGFSSQDDFKASFMLLLYTIFTFILPFLIIAFLNWSVLKTANNLLRNAVGPNINGPELSQQDRQEMSRRARERKAAVDVSIIIAAFLLCFFPVWITGLCRQFVKSTKVPAEVILSTNCIFLVSSLCNPIIYSIRKEDFRAAVMKVLRRMGACRSSNDIHANNPRLPARLRAETDPSTAQQNSPHIIRADENMEARDLQKLE